MLEDGFCIHYKIKRSFNEQRNLSRCLYKNEEPPQELLHEKSTADQSLPQTTTVAKGGEEPAAAIARIVAANTKTSKDNVNELRTTPKAALTDCPLNAELRCVL